MLSAEIIAIGSELLTPTKTDTNSLWLTEKLNEIGIEVKLKIIVGDDELRLKETIKDAISRSDIVITTGGLGPTEDDITRKISAEAIGRKLIFREDILASISKKFLKMNREMPEINKRQAFIIEDGDVLPNPNGSAPGMAVEIDNKYLIILPGPPRELKPMFENFVLPKLKQTAGEIFVKRKVLRVTGMGESAIDEIIAPVYTQYKNPQTSTLFNRSEVEIQLTAQGKNEDEADQMLKDLADKIVAKLGIAVFSVNGELMEEVVGRLLIESEKTLSVAESCTGGLIAQRLTEIPGSSKFFVEGVVAYANTAKIRTLNVPSDLIEKFGAVSAEVAEAMAKNLLEQSETDFAISVTGIAGPAGGTEEKPVGLVFIGYASQEEVKYIKLNLPGDRHLIRWRASQAALDFLRRKMIRMKS
ncbi:MAG: competence/damage-inducible protein A [Acidobacteria bacterium]|jgi:nicotinamide-nucleotide amidase|nr:competence/damage-inducible protein A [Acidobacteriota bacterium]